MLKIKKFFIERRAGFYVSAAAVLAVIAGAFVYLAVYNGTPYMSWMVFVLPFISAAAFAVLCSFGKTETTAPVLCAVLNFISFLIYIHAVYLYLSEVFFGGITAEAFSRMDPGFVSTAMLYFFSAVLGNVGLYLPQSAADSKRRHSKTLTEFSGEGNE